ncbi:hypothetical protein CHUAL_001290 [Chamberlinius hualienensis]
MAGVIGLIDAIIAIVGTAKMNKPLLQIHLVVLGLNAIGGIYSFTVAFSLQAIIGLFITSLRIGVASRLIQLLRTNSPVSDSPGAIQPFNLAPQNLAILQIEDDGLPSYDSLFEQSALVIANNTNQPSNSTEYDDFQKSKLDSEGLKVYSIVFIVIGALGIIGGIIAIVGTVKENLLLLSIHLVVLNLALLGAIYRVFATFSIQDKHVFSAQNIVGLLIIGFRVGFEYLLIHFLKKESQQKDKTASETSKNAT